MCAFGGQKQQPTIIDSQDRRAKAAADSLSRQRAAAQGGAQALGGGLNVLDQPTLGRQFLLGR